MGKAITITRLDLTASELRAAATKAKDVSAARRMLCLAMVLEGADRTTAAESCGMDRQTLRDWVHRYNAEGLPGLYDRKPPGARPKLTAEQRVALAAPTPLLSSSYRVSPESVLIVRLGSEVIHLRDV
jgi:hypothetical protein